MNSKTDIEKLIDELWSSDLAAALTNKAARAIEKLNNQVVTAERKHEPEKEALTRRVALLKEAISSAKIALHANPTMASDQLFEKMATAFAILDAATNKEEHAQR